MSGQRLLAASGQIPMAAHTRMTGFSVSPPEAHGRRQSGEPVRPNDQAMSLVRAARVLFDAVSLGVVGGSGRGSRVRPTQRTCGGPVIGMAHQGLD